MYPNLRAEIARRGLKLTDLSEMMDLTVATVSQKLNGKFPITLAEAKKLKTILDVDLPLETLFQEAE